MGFLTSVIVPIFSAIVGGLFSLFVTRKQLITVRRRNVIAHKYLINRIIRVNLNAPHNKDYTLNLAHRVNVRYNRLDNSFMNDILPLKNNVSSNVYYRIIKQYEAVTKQEQNFQDVTAYYQTNFDDPKFKNQQTKIVDAKESLDNALKAYLKMLRE